MRLLYLLLIYHVDVENCVYSFTYNQVLYRAFCVDNAEKTTNRPIHSSGSLTEVHQVQA